MVDNASIVSRPSPLATGDSDPDRALTSTGDFSEPKEEKSVLLATGSADPYAYLYNVGEVFNNPTIWFHCRLIHISIRKAQN